MRGPHRRRRDVNHSSTWMESDRQKSFKGCYHNTMMPFAKIRLNQNSPWGPRGPHKTGLRGNFFTTGWGLIYSTLRANLQLYFPFSVILASHNLLFISKPPSILPAKEICLCVCNQGAYADNFKEAVDRLLICSVEGVFAAHECNIQLYILDWKTNINILQNVILQNNFILDIPLDVLKVSSTWLCSIM